MKATIEDAYILARQIKENSTKVQAVELHGSVLQNGTGHDIDLILIVDDELAQEYWLKESELRSDMQVHWPPRLLWLRRINKKLLRWLDEALIQRKKLVRQQRASDLIGVDIAQLCKDYRPGIIVEVWLLPEDWKTGQDLNPSALSRIGDLVNHKYNFDFLAGIARNATKIA